MSATLDRPMNVDVLRLDAAMCRELPISMRREWLETNGRGGFAFGTVAGARTRRYHSLLTVATRPPGGRMVLLSSLEEAVRIGEERCVAESGALVTIPAGTLHHVRSVGTVPLFFLTVYAPPAY